MLKKFNFIKFSTLFIRVSGVGSRFLLAFFLTKYISLEFQGGYTLIISTVTLLIILLGLDFYIYSNRLIVKNSDNQIFCLKNALVFYFFTYILLFILLWAFYYFYPIIKVPFYLFYFLIVFEHLGQEFFRIYIVLKKVLFANILLFVRTGLWSSILVLSFFFIEGFKISLNSILLLWLISAFITCVLGFSFYPNIKLFFRTEIDRNWIYKGVLVGLTMFLSTICLKIMEYSDRYLIAFFLDKKQLGIYSLFFQISNFINVILFTLYISFLYPDILKGVYEKSHKDLKKAKSIIIKNTTIVVVVFSIFSILGLPYIIEYVGKPELYDKRFIIYILIAGSLFLNYSFASHYVIIGFEKEKLIFKATFVACIFNVALNLILIPIIGIYGPAIALLVGNIILFLLKRKYERNLTSKW